MTYKIICSVNNEIQLSGEYLGDAFGALYESLEEAQEVALSLQESVEEFGLHPETTYQVVEA